MTEGLDFLNAKKSNIWGSRQNYEHEVFQKKNTLGVQRLALKKIERSDLVHSTKSCTALKNSKLQQKLFSELFEIKKNLQKLQYLLSDEDWDGCDGFW